ncbi:uncharacterized protein AMSG_11668 [Thecamonas trahens ATCC 50062]|uniref:Uncharacterized protein n=1 Tax=Thecamonas trahens ATCC 50062 TaxID=461836 RepID=A0A0L0DU05_THETB|nr:hypothetical protein AMSG_11668 [Thecamonas trahens ATCC 50062]KNC55531.1 hypothetical protein AMSG_11668 [Thecamonas trahens ATCC 50062]|eukprot:XP_013761474.1 hypothetical protein AMSG_11668 [Thecamonas trahens ATCC 50062]
MAHDELIARAERIASLEGELEYEQAHMRRQLAECNERVSEMQALLAAAEKRASASARLRDERLGELAAVLSEAENASSDRVAGASSALARAIARARALVAEVSSTRDARDEARRQLVEQEARTAEAESRLEAMSTRLRTVESELATVLESQGELVAMQVELEETRDQAVAELNETREREKVVAVAADEHVAALQAQLNSSTGFALALEAEIESLHHELAKTESTQRAADELRQLNEARSAEVAARLEEAHRERASSESAWRAERERLARQVEAAEAAAATTAAELAKEHGEHARTKTALAIEIQRGKDERGRASAEQVAILHSEIAMLRGRNRALEAEIASSQARAAALESDLTSLRSQAAGLAVDLDSSALAASEHNETLALGLDASEHRIAVLEAELTAARGRIAVLEGGLPMFPGAPELGGDPLELHELSIETLTLEDRVTELEHALAESREVAARAQARVDSLESARMGMAADLAAAAHADVKRMDALARVERMKGELEEVQARVEQAESQLDQARTRAEQAESQLDQARARAEQAESQLVQTRTRAEQAESQLDQARARAEQAESQLDQARVRVERMDGELDQVRTRAEQAESQLDQTRTRAEQAESQLDQARVRVEQAESQLDQTKARAEQAESQLDQTRIRAEQAESQLDQTKARAEQAESQLDQTRTRAEQAESQLDQVRVRVERMDGELDQTRTRAEQAESQLDQTRTRAEQAESQLDQVRVRVERMDGELDQVRTRAEQAENQLDQARVRVERMDGELDQARTRAEQAESQLDQAKARAAQAEGQLDQTKARAREAENKLQQANIRLQQANHKLKQTATGTESKNHAEQAEALLCSAKAQAHQAETELAATAERARETRAALETEQARVRVLTEDLEASRAACSSLRNRLERTEDELEAAIKAREDAIARFHTGMADARREADLARADADAATSKAAHTVRQLESETDARVYALEQELRTARATADREAAAAREARADLRAAQSRLDAKLVEAERHVDARITAAVHAETLRLERELGTLQSELELARRAAADAVASHDAELASLRDSAAREAAAAKSASAAATQAARERDVAKSRVTGLVQATEQLQSTNAELRASMKRIIEWCHSRISMAHFPFPPHLAVSSTSSSLSFSMAHGSPPPPMVMTPSTPVSSSVHRSSPAMTPTTPTAAPARPPPSTPPRGDTSLERLFNSLSPMLSPPTTHRTQSRPRPQSPLSSASASASAAGLEAGWSDVLADVLYPLHAAVDGADFLIAELERAYLERMRVSAAFVRSQERVRLLSEQLIQVLDALEVERTRAAAAAHSRSEHTVALVNNALAATVEYGGLSGALHVLDVIEDQALTADAPIDIDDLESSLAVLTAEVEELAHRVGDTAVTPELPALLSDSYARVLELLASASRADDDVASSTGDPSPLELAMAAISSWVRAAARGEPAPSPLEDPEVRLALQVAVCRRRASVDILVDTDGFDSLRPPSNKKQRRKMRNSSNSNVSRDFDSSMSEFSSGFPLTAAGDSVGSIAGGSSMPAVTGEPVQDKVQETGGGAFTRVAMCHSCGASLAVAMSTPLIQCASCSALLDVGPPATIDDPDWVPLAPEDIAHFAALAEDNPVANTVDETINTSLMDLSGADGASVAGDDSVDEAQRRVRFGDVTSHDIGVHVGLSESQARSALRRYIKSTKMRRRNFADSVFIESIERLGAFAVFLESFLEFRKLVPTERPADASALAVEVPASGTPWSLDVMPPPSFQAFHELRVPVDLAGDRPAMRCSRCEGSGSVPCGWCDGEGIDYEHHNACQQCGQHGAVVCTQCEGTGRTKQAADLLAMWQTPRFERAFVPGTDSNLARKLPIDQLVVLSSFSPALYELRQPHKLTMDDVATSLPEAMRNVIEEVLGATPLIVPDNARLVAQRITVRSMPIYRVHYHPDSEFYVFGGGRGSSSLSATKGQTGSAVSAPGVAADPRLRRTTRGREWYGVVATGIPIDSARAIMSFICIGLLLALIAFSFLLS